MGFCAITHAFLCTLAGLHFERHLLLFFESVVWVWSAVGQTEFPASTQSRTATFSGCFYGKEMPDNFSNTFKDWIEIILIGSAGFSSVR